MTQRVGGGSVATAESAEWLAGLQSGDPATQAGLHQLLLRAARSEVSRRSARLDVTGPELDDIAHQAADDAMVSILGKLSTFRGESRFTTWAYKFAIFEVAGKMTRHFWVGSGPAPTAEQWERLPDRFGIGPAEAAQAKAMFDAVRDCVEHELTEKQRRVFGAIVLEGVPLDVLVGRTGSSRGAIYKALFDARRKIRLRLVTNGYLSEEGVR